MTRPLLTCLALLMLFPALASAVNITLDRPGDREFVRDTAKLIAEPDVEAIRALCDKLLTEKATPIIVVTIEQMADHGGAGMRIETFARLLFDQWEIGHAKLGGQNWNTGILLLVSKGDRKARIELGAGWGKEKDALCQQIMDEQIIPRFKQGDFSAGIKAGVAALDAMAREKELPKAPTPWWVPVTWMVFFGLMIFTVVSMVRNGSSGWAWLFWGAVFALVGTILYNMLANSRRGGGGGFSGGSFGGGFSGGGGASGSW